MQTDYQKIKEIIEEHHDEILESAINFQKKMNRTAQDFLDCFITSRSVIWSFDYLRESFIDDMCRITKLDKFTCSFFADNYLR